MQTAIFWLKNFNRNEDGIATVWAMFWLTICFALSGLAIDVTNAWKTKQILQSTADVSSVSSAMEFYFTNPDSDLEVRVKNVANQFASANMSEGWYGDVLRDQSIILGYWNGVNFNAGLDYATQFPNAVRVITEQVGDLSLGTYFLRFVGIFDFDVQASSVSAFHLMGCNGAAILSMGNIMIEGNNSFSNFCIYGMQGVDVQASNYFGEGAMVGMPNLEDCASGNSRHAHCDKESMATSEGFFEALLNGLSGFGSEPSTLDDKTLAAANFFDGIADSTALSDDIGFLIDRYLYESFYGTYIPDSEDETAYPETYKADSKTEYLSGKVEKVDMTPFIEAENYQVWEATIDDTTGDPVIDPESDDAVGVWVDAPYSIPLFDIVNPDSGTTYIVDCTQLDPDLSYKMNMGGSASERDFSGIAVIGLDCDYKFDTTISYSSAFITTTSTSGLKGNGRASISSSAGAYLGNANQTCDGDKFTLLTQGSLKFGSKLKGSNFDFVVAGTVNLASGSNSDPEAHVGSSITALNDVHISSHHTFNGCGPWAMTEGDLGNKRFRVSIVQ